MQVLLYATSFAAAAVPESQRDCVFTTSCGKICCSSVSCGLVKADIDAGRSDHCGKACPPHATSCGEKCCSSVSCGIVSREVAAGVRDECGHYKKVVDVEDEDSEESECSEESAEDSEDDGITCPPITTRCGLICCSAVSCMLMGRDIKAGIRDKCGRFVDVGEDEHSYEDEDSDEDE
jgi:hypothetical protein